MFHSIDTYLGVSGVLEKIDLFFPPTDVLEGVFLPILLVEPGVWTGPSMLDGTV